MSPEVDCFALLGQGNNPLGSFLPPRMVEAYKDGGQGERPVPTMVYHDRGQSLLPSSKRIGTFGAAINVTRCSLPGGCTSALKHPETTSRNPGRSNTRRWWFDGTCQLLGFLPKTLMIYCCFLVLGWLKPDCNWSQNDYPVTAIHEDNS